MSVRLLRESAAPGPAAASAGVSLPQAGARQVRPPPARAADPPERRRAPAGAAPALRAASDERQARRPSAAPLRSEDPVEFASALASPVQPLARPDAAQASSLAQTASRAPSVASGPAGGPPPGLVLGPGDGAGAGRLDRVARPAGPIRPHYPAGARQRGEEADVILDVWVGARGDVDRVAVSRSAGAEFDAAAIAAVEKAWFHPALRDGKRVPSRAALRLHFRLE